VYFESTIEADVSCNYYVLDDKRNFILGAGLRQADQPLMHVKKDGRYFITYKTRLPLEEASYSLQLQITTPITLDQSARFLDVIENALIFKVSRRAGARLWSKVYIENEVEVTCC
jgi:lipopolysaccharide transport system ATP-binding protein